MKFIERNDAALKKGTQNVIWRPKALLMLVLFIALVIVKISGEIPAEKDAVTDVTNHMTVHFIDVGQADSILITMEDSAMLIDAGNNEDSQLVVDYIKARGITTLDYIIATHPHEDHIGGMDAVINVFEVKNIIMPKVESNTRTFEEVLKAISNKGLKITPPVPGTVYPLGKAEFVILAPNSDRYDDTNNYSVVVKLRYGDTSFLFTGDAGFESENEMIEKGYDLQSDVLKVGHHGSAYSTSRKFLGAVRPQIAVISVGKGNEYGHPAPETIQKLRQANAEIYRTDEQGTIVITSNGKTIKVFADKN
ncbi:MBL fold metallo-hydrolase [Caldicoprobacter algeriensis]|uniref:ComEC/Rec2 family competence protein n=1 Tax=Caldicoprobacter algeriensis TaxID=699281 RepID=UPI0020794F2A|nr:ComEC/Rec2 family competence protein [Caldicoprobacter algeriensis]MCM8900731.1 MBL fold metallo-hydrolase [Caldicoprobacter algeriensis]